uniref:Uncharacterized protein n=1 Tax=Mola mola TaxID=94237 RepID=A0A3Q4A988_MOLML
MLIALALTTVYLCQCAMEDPIEGILQDHGRVLCTSRSHPVLSGCMAAVITGLFVITINPALLLSCIDLWYVCTVPQVPYLPSSEDKMLNMLSIMKLLEGRAGRLVDPGSGDRIVAFAASSAGFQCTGFEINSILVAYAQRKARWKGLSSGQIDLSANNNVTAFLAPGVMGVLGEKLLKELPDDARIISPVGSGLHQTFAYDISSVRSHLAKVPNTVV